MGGFRKLQLDNKHFGQSKNGREEEAPEPTQQVKAVLTHPFSISTGLSKVPYYVSRWHLIQAGSGSSPAFVAFLRTFSRLLSQCLETTRTRRKSFYWNLSCFRPRRIRQKNNHSLLSDLHSRLSFLLKASFLIIELEERASSQFPPLVSPKEIITPNKNC